MAASQADYVFMHPHPETNPSPRYPHRTHGPLLADLQRLSLNFSEEGGLMSERAFEKQMREGFNATEGLELLSSHGS